ncbi:MAG: 3-dehydroquinate synthase, partial [Armatimonadota bacterium]
CEAKLPTEIPHGLEPRNLVRIMGIDKKASKDGLALSLLTGLGTCKLLKGIDGKLLEGFLSRQ